MDLRKNFSKNLTQLRIDNKLTQTNIAKQVGISCSSYQAYEWGITLPTVENLVKIADIFDVSVDFLLGRANI